MKLLRELLIILSIYFIGQLISTSLHLPVPGNILGMLILLILLISNKLKLSQIETVSNFFLDHLAFLFIPACVGLMTSIYVIKDSWYKVLIVIVVTTIVIMISTGHIVQFLSRKKLKKEGK